MEVRRIKILSNKELSSNVIYMYNLIISIFFINKEKHNLCKYTEKKGRKGLLTQNCIVLYIGHVLRIFLIINYSHLTNL